MVGLGEVDELEVEREGARQLVGTGGVFGLLVDSGEHGGEIAGRLWGPIFFVFAALAGSLAERFHGLIDTGRSLFPQDNAEQHAERADIAAQRRSF